MQWWQGRGQNLERHARDPNRRRVRPLLRPQLLSARSGPCLIESVLVLVLPFHSWWENLPLRRQKGHHFLGWQ
jgi:hypothetical protein